MPHPQVLRDLALFVEVAKRLSFSQAAAALDMPVSSLSRRITQFEAAIGLRLLDRTTRKIALTAYGEAYLAQATQVVEEAQRSFDELVAQARGPSGLLKVAVPTDHWVVRHLSEIVSAFARQHEHIHVHLDLRASQVDLVQENYDLAIVGETPREASLIVRKISVIENGLFAAPSYLAAHGRPTHPSELSGHEVLLSTAAEAATWQFQRGGETVSATVRGRLSCNSLSFARRLAITGRGIAAVSVVNVERDLDKGRLEPVLADWAIPPTSIYAVTTSRLIPAKVRHFIDFLALHLGRTFSEVPRLADRIAHGGNDAAIGEPGPVAEACWRPSDRPYRLHRAAAWAPPSGND
ncbi:HTH-type transcriptional regulator DmlR [Methylobacterium hispanicum]|jgi:DNA-binding transcriptional LysR family regulator|uniref:HTH-type transcriptional regulator DmlR n=1 Tax=Methylobacterium hispanicum TaxID=270350 RepID=A0AAV4ZPQ7_9HYPH|nr:MULTISPECIES: LysR family transcriptional regulator [Methylobacterium]GJD90129.1 HTH-type transcriptional regulator DmlR [Methylobacterium hispanicum]